MQRNYSRFQSELLQKLKTAIRAIEVHKLWTYFLFALYDVAIFITLTTKIGFLSDRVECFYFNTMKPDFTSSSSASSSTWSRRPEFPSWRSFDCAPCWIPSSSPAPFPFPEVREDLRRSRKKPISRAPPWWAEGLRRTNQSLKKRFQKSVATWKPSKVVRSVYVNEISYFRKPTSKSCRLMQLQSKIFVVSPFNETRFRPIHRNLLRRLCNWPFEQNNHKAWALHQAGIWHDWEQKIPNRRSIL